MKRLGLIALALALVLAALAGAALYLVTMPWRMLGRMYQPKRRSGSKGLTVALVESTLALALSAFGLRRQGHRLTPAWHPCENCGAPIDLPSRAAYCSQACRRDANIRHRAALIADEAPF